MGFRAVHQVPLPTVLCVERGAWRLPAGEWLVTRRWWPTFSSAGQLDLVLKLEMLCSLEQLRKHIEFFFLHAD